MVRGPVVVFGGSKPTLEIKPTSPFVVLYGNKHEAQPAELTGTLVLTNPDSMQVKSIRMKLEAVRKVSWMTNTVTPQPIVNKTKFFERRIVIFPADGNVNNKPHKINAGSHAWPFKFEIPGDIDESVEGLMGTYIIYSLHATVDRGYMNKNLVASKHIRVTRTLGLDTLDTMPMEQINEDIWANKIAYKITVPQKDYIVGTSITADFILIPLRKGVEIGTIRMEVSEHMILTTEVSGRPIHNTRDTVVAWKDQEMPPDAKRTLPEGVDQSEQLFDEAYHFKLTLDLPKSLKICRQSVETDNIKISHKLKLYVNLHNPEGHTSQLLVKNHLHLFVSPFLPPGEDQSVTVNDEVVAANAMRGDASVNAPPTYGAHQLDELYNDLDSGLMTPAPRGSGTNTGWNTPFYALSRNPSVENLRSLNAMASPEGIGASASALHSRLSRLSMAQNRTSVHWPDAPSQHASGATTPFEPRESTSGRESVQGSYFDGVEGDPAAEEYDMEGLTRIPSYNTAVRTPARTPISEDLPTYEWVTSRPASPVHSPVSGRSGASTPSGGLGRSGTTTPNGLATLNEETLRNTLQNSRRNSEQMEQPGPR